MYESFYKLAGRPFQLTPDLRFLYPSAGHKRALSYLHYGLEQAEGFVVITGHIGTGKTMLIQTLLAELKDQEIATARIATANLDEHNVLQTVAAALKLPHEGKSKVALLRDMELSLRRAQDYLKGVLLIVDEAQTLTRAALEEMRVLSNLECNGKALLQVFLIGQSELRDLLRGPDMEQLRQRTIASYHLQPLSVDEVKRYVGFRLVAVGWDGDPAFDKDFYDALHARTEGIPRKVNMLMERLLVFGFLEELRSFSAADIDKVVGEMSEEISGDLGTKTNAAQIAAQIESEEAGAAAADAEAAGKATAVPSRDELESRLAQLEARLEQLSGSSG